MIQKKSQNDVATTLDRLENLLKEKGIAVIARVDHARSAEKVGMALRPTQVLFFGNPKLGTPLMQENQTAGLELPMRVLTWEDSEGQTWLAYTSPQSIAESHNLSQSSESIGMMMDALNNLTEHAISTS